jgi:DNA-binding NarL/FixJ family response regulator
MMAQPQKSTLRILIVDDTAQVRRDLKTVLSMMDIEAGVYLEIVGEAADGQEAIRETATLKPDVVLMDLAMPVMNGFAATQVIKAGNPHTRVVILTIYDDAESREKAQLAGADDFIEKGVSLDRLFQAVAPSNVIKRE